MRFEDGGVFVDQVIAAGFVIVEIGVALIRPAEFTVLRFFSDAKVNKQNTNQHKLPYEVLKVAGVWLTAQDC